MSLVVSFGDSFIWGSEIPNNRDGRLAWAGLAARAIGAEYKTLSVPGCGNEIIAQQIYDWFSRHTGENTLAVINWTWTLRWDFYLKDHQQWITLGPTCVPEKLQHLIDSTQSHRIVDFYQDYANSSLLWNKFRSLQSISAAQRFLESRGITTIETYMDAHLFDQQYHAPEYIQQIQALVQPRMLDWNGLNFLDWAQSRGHEISEVGRHPLASAHQDAAEFWKERYAQAFA